MPSYAHLLNDKMDYDKIAPHVRAAWQLGAPYSSDDLNNTAEVAYKQAERIAAEIATQGGPADLVNDRESVAQAVALIAYLQRVGIDLFATPESETPAASDSTASDSNASDSTAPAGENSGDGETTDAVDSPE